MSDVTTYARDATTERAFRRIAKLCGPSLVGFNAKRDLTPTVSEGRHKPLSTRDPGKPGSLHERIVRFTASASTPAITVGGVRAPERTLRARAWQARSTGFDDGEAVAASWHFANLGSPMDHGDASRNLAPRSSARTGLPTT